MRVSSTVRKWSAVVALVAIAVSGIGVTGFVIFGSMTTPDPSQPAAPRTTLAQSSPKVPTPGEFTVNVIVTDQQCAPDGKCAYKYTIEPKYIGFHPLPEKQFTVFYEVTGGHQPQKGEFTVIRDQAKIFKDVVLEGPPGAKLQAVVTKVTA